MQTATDVRADSPAPPEPEPGAWRDEVLSIIALLKGGAMQRLEWLAANPPTGADEVAAALSAVHGALDVPRDARDPVETARNRGQTVASGMAPLPGCFGRLVWALRQRAAALTEDPADPTVRLSDFGKEQPRVKVLAPDSPNAGALVGEVDALMPGHPLRSGQLLGGGLVVLGQPGETKWRLSAVRAKTAEAVARQRAREQCEAAIREAEAAALDRRSARARG